MHVQYIYHETHVLSFELVSSYGSQQAQNKWYLFELNSFTSCSYLLELKGMICSFDCLVPIIVQCTARHEGRTLI